MSRPLVIVVVALVLVGVLLVAGGGGLLKGVGDVFRPFMAAPLFVAGGTIQSVSCDEICRISVVVDKGAQRVLLGTDDLNARMPSGKKFTHNLELDFRPIQQQGQYDIVTTSPTLSGFRFGWVYKEGWTKSIGSEQVACSTSNLAYDFVAEANNYPWPSDDYTVRACVYETQAGEFGDVVLKTIESGADVGVTVAGTGKQATARVISAVPTAQLPGGVGVVRYTGDLVTWDQPPEPMLFAAFYDRATNRWNIITRRLMEDYANALSDTRSALKLIRDECQPNLLTRLWSGAVGCRGKTKAGVGVFLDSTIERPETLLQDIIRKTSLPIELANAQTSLGVQSGAKLLVPLNVQVGSPTITLEVNAKWAEVETISGKPQVRVAGGCEIQSGSPSSVAVEVTNIGPGPGVFALSSVCGGNIGLSGFSGSMDFAAGQSRSVQVSTTSPLGSGSSSCTFRAVDRGSGETAETSTTCSVTAPRVCTLGQVEVDGQNIVSCAVDAGGKPAWRVEKTCVASEIIARSVTGSLSCQTITATVERGGGSVESLPEEIQDIPGRTSGERSFFGCDFWCKLGRVNKVIWLVVGLLIFGLIFIGVRMRRGY